MKTIAGVQAHQLQVIEDDRGAVLHMLRGHSELGLQVGEIYFSEVRPGGVKAWKRHLRMTQRLTVPVGHARFVLFDDRANSATRGNLIILEFGRSVNYCLLIIPPGIWYGFEGLGDVPTLIANCPDLPYDQNEVERVSPLSELIPYHWEQ